MFDWIVAILFLTIGYFTGTLEPTGLLRREKPRIATGKGWLFAFLTLAGLVSCRTAAEPIWNRLQIDVEGVIVARQDIPKDAMTHGPVTAYSLRRSDGSSTGYTATGGDMSLPRTMPVGTSIAKQRWELSYVVNGQPVHDFPLTHYVAFLAAGLACLAGAGIVLATRRNEPLMMGPLP